MSFMMQEFQLLHSESVAALALLSSSAIPEDLPDPAQLLVRGRGRGYCLLYPRSGLGSK